METPCLLMWETSDLFADENEPMSYFLQQFLKTRCNII